MRLSRLTTRRLMVLVAVVALITGTFVTWQRQRRYRELAVEYARRERSGRALRKWIAADRVPARGARSVGILIDGIPIDVKLERTARLRAEYERAARYPWLPVPPDPPPE